MKSKRARPVLALALVAASIAALGSLAGPVSPASAITSSHKWSYLHFPPWQQRGECLPVRRLSLNGTYRWRVYTRHWAHPETPFWRQRLVRLRGLYSWFVCRYHLREGYRFYTEFANTSGGGRVMLEHRYFGGHYGDGSYDWGSTINRVGP